MKKLLILIACIATTLVACTKHLDVKPAPAQVYFSRVQYFKDGRKPATDTVWTLHLTTQAEIDQYAPQNGYIYAETSTYVDKGAMWTR